MTIIIGPLPGSGDLKTLSEFHFNYENNNKNYCRSGWAAWLRPGGVRTDDPKRRPLFLLYDRENFYSPGFSTLYGRVVKPILNSAVGTVFGQLVTGDENSKVALLRFAQFKVQMTNYRVSAGGNGCFSFPVSTYTEGRSEERLPLKEVDVVLRDLEQLQRVGFPDMFRPEKTTWNFPIE